MRRRGAARTARAKEGHGHGASSLHLHPVKKRRDERGNPSPSHIMSKKFVECTKTLFEVRKDF